MNLEAKDQDTIIPQTKKQLNNKPQIIYVKDDDSSLSLKDYINLLLAAVTAAVALYSIYFSRKALKASEQTLKYNAQALEDNIKNRNLTFLGEIDKMLIDEPMLWEFYDGNRDKYNLDKLKGQIRAFAYYKLNHFT